MKREGPDSVLLPVVPRGWSLPALGGASGEEPESGLATAGGRGAPAAAGRSGISNLSYTKEGLIAEYLCPLPMHAYLTWQRWRHFLEKVPLAFKGTSYLGWETHIFHRHGLLCCFIKTPGMIFATQDMYTPKTIP